MKRQTTRPKAWFGKPDGGKRLIIPLIVKQHWQRDNFQAYLEILDDLSIGIQGFAGQYVIAATSFSSLRIPSSQDMCFKGRLKAPKRAGLGDSASRLEQIWTVKRKRASFFKGYWLTTLH